MGFSCAEIDDPYTAMMEIVRRPLVYRAVVLSLASVYREELTIIAAIKKRFPHVEIWLAQADGRLAALAEALRLGADGLISEEGMERTALSVAPAPVMPGSNPAPAPVPAAEAPVMRCQEMDIAETGAGEPVLTADELRALLQEQPSLPPSDG
jgi:hypothetical protein